MYESRDLSFRPVAHAMPQGEAKGGCPTQVTRELPFFALRSPAQALAARRASLNQGVRSGRSRMMCGSPHVATYAIGAFFFYFLTSVPRQECIFERAGDGSYLFFLFCITRRKSVWLVACLTV